MSTEAITESLPIPKNAREDQLVHIGENRVLGKVARLFGSPARTYAAVFKCMDAHVAAIAALRAWHDARVIEKHRATASLCAPSDVKLQQAWSDARTARVTAEAALAELAEGLSASPPCTRGGTTDAK